MIKMSSSQANNFQEIIDVFNKVSKSDTLLLKRCADLIEEKAYIVHRFVRQVNKVGEGVIATLSEAPYKEGDVARFEVYLPKRFQTALQNVDLESIPVASFYLVSHGSCGNNSTELTLHRLSKTYAM